MKTTRKRPGGEMIAAIAVRANRTVSVLSAVLFVFLFCSCATIHREPVCNARVPDVEHIDVHGNVYLAQLPTGLLRKAFDDGDTAVATFLGKTFRLTIVSDIHDASPGVDVLHFHPEKPAYVRMATVNGAFAVATGIAKPVPGENGGRPSWVPADGVEFPIVVTFAREGGPGRPPIAVPSVRRSNRREDYPGLSDADFANFRPVSAPSMASGVLYRSSSPIDPSLGRSRFADAALSNACVKSVWNMADTADGAAAYPDIGKTYYRNHCTVRFATPLGTDFESALFKAGVLGGLLFLSENDPPFLLHCKEGRDRTGVVAILLEALCGASRAEMEADYLKSYENFSRGDFDRKKAADSFQYNMKALGLDGVPDAELRKRAAEYLRDIGMEPHEVQALLDRLTRSK